MAQSYFDDLGLGVGLASLQPPNQVRLRLVLLLAPARRGKRPLVQAQSAFSERLLEALIGTGYEAVD